MAKLKAKSKAKWIVKLKGEYLVELCQALEKNLWTDEMKETTTVDPKMTSNYQAQIVAKVLQLEVVPEQLSDGPDVEYDE
jgi:hypothetical protein